METETAQVEKHKQSLTWGELVTSLLEFPSPSAGFSHMCFCDPLTPQESRPEGV